MARRTRWAGWQGTRRRCHPACAHREQRPASTQSHTDFLLRCHRPNTHAHRSNLRRRRANRRDLGRSGPENEVSNRSNKKWLRIKKINILYNFQLQMRSHFLHWSEALWRGFHTKDTQRELLAARDPRHDPEIDSRGERTLNDEYVYAAVVRPSVSWVSIGVFVPCGISTPAQHNSMTDRQVGRFHLSCTLISFLKD